MSRLLLLEEAQPSLGHTNCGLVALQTQSPSPQVEASFLPRIGKLESQWRMLMSSSLRHRQEPGALTCRMWSLT